MTEPRPHHILRSRDRGRVGSVALWDNRCAMHNPINDYHGYTWTMHRITFAGDVPR